MPEIERTAANGAAEIPVTGTEEEVLGRSLSKDRAALQRTSMRSPTELRGGCGDRMRGRDTRRSLERGVAGSRDVAQDYVTQRQWREKRRGWGGSLFNIRRRFT